MDPAFFIGGWGGKWGTKEGSRNGEWGSGDLRSWASRKKEEQDKKIILNNLVRVALG